jgi:hypothetical protein
MDRLPLFGRVSYGLLKQLRLDMLAGWGMVGKLNFRRTNDLIVVTWLSSFGRSTPSLMNMADLLWRPGMDVT